MEHFYQMNDSQFIGIMLAITKDEEYDNTTYQLFQVQKLKAEVLAFSSRS